MIKVYLNFIGVLYLFTSILGSLIGFSLSILIRVEISNPFTVLGEYFYYVSITSHAFVMVFMFLTTLSTGVYYILLPKLCFLKNMYCSYLTLTSFFLYLVSLLLLILSLLSGEGINSSWTLYTPLSLSVYSSSISLDFAIISLIVFTISSLLSSLNIILTVIFSFKCFESLLDVPILSWSALLTSLLIIFSNPSLICVLIMLLSDRNLNSFYFDSEFGGSPLLFQSLFWIWGHPEVYVLVLPVFGIVSEVISKISGGVLYNRKGIIFSMVSLTILSFLVWGHHMVTVGWDIDIKGFFMVTTVIISIPTGVKVFSWVYTLFLKGFVIDLPFLLVNMFVITFILGGITGVFLSNYSLDILFHDSYFVVGHFHTILAVSSVLGFISSYCLFYKVKDEDLSTNVQFSMILLFISISQLLLSFYLKGLKGIARRISNYPCEFYLLFYTGSIGSLGVWVFILLITLLFLYYLNCLKQNKTFYLSINCLTSESNVDSGDSSKDIVLYVPEFNVDRKDFPRDIELYCSRKYSRGDWHYSIPYKYFKEVNSVYLKDLRFIAIDLDISAGICIEKKFYKKCGGNIFRNSVLLQYSFNSHDKFIGYLGDDKFYDTKKKCWVIKSRFGMSKSNKVVVCRSFICKIYLDRISNNSNLREFILKYIMWRNKTISVKIISIHLFHDTSHNFKLFVEYSYNLNIEESVFSLLPSMPPVVGVYLNSNLVKGLSCLCSNVEYKLVPSMITEVRNRKYFNKESHLTLVGGSLGAPSVIRVVFLSWSPYVRRCWHSKKRCG